MLQFMRKHARSWIMKLLLGLIIVVFIFYFGSLRWSKEAESIAEVDGKYITQSEYQREFQNTMEMYRQTMGGNVPEEVLKSLNLPKRVLDNLVNKAVLLSLADRMGIGVSDGEVREHIRAYPGFQRNGAFDERIYQQMLKYNRISAEDFEDAQRKALRINKLEGLIKDGAKVSEREVLEMYRLGNERVNLDIFRLPARNCRKGVKPAEKDLEAFAADNAEKLRVPEQVQVKFLVFRAEDHAKSVQVTPEEVRAQYENMRVRLEAARKPVPPLAQVQDGIAREIRQGRAMAAAAQEAKKAHDVIYQEENFDEYAKKKGLAVTTTGFFSGAAVPVELQQVKGAAEEIFQLRDSDISPVLSGPRGHYVFKLVARKPSYVLKLAEARPLIEEKYIEEQAANLCRREAEEILDRARKGEDIRALARAKGMDVSETGLFQAAAGSIPKMGSSKEVLESVFPLNEKNPYADRVFFVDGSFVILKLKGRQTMDPKDFEARKGQIREYLFRLKQNDHFNVWLEEQKEIMTREGKISIKPEATKM